MRTIKTIAEMKKVLGGIRKPGMTLGFVPTMGALHDGHLSLIRQARRENDFVVVSIFVNPLQFGPSEDLAKYPRPVQKDKKLLEAAKTNILFLPSAQEMYGESFSTVIDAMPLKGQVRLMTEVLCGKSRPGHFRGVMTVVAKLFHIVQPDRAYFGLKDYQQAKVIQRMAADLNFPIQIRLMPIVRDKDGLALSSRNRYLSPEERRKAVHLSKVLLSLRAELLSGKKDLSRLIKNAKKSLASKVDRVDYFTIADPSTLADLKRPKPVMLIAAACYVGKTRLIDNTIVKI